MVTRQEYLAQKTTVRHLGENKLNKRLSAYLHLVIHVNWFSDDTKTNYLIKHYSMRIAQ